MSKKNKLTKKEIIIMFIMMLSFLPLMILIFISKSRKIDEKMKAYPELYRASVFASRLQEITMEMGIKNKGAVYIDLCDGTKFSLLENLWNLGYSPNNMHDFIQKGDSIYKRVNSDTICIYRNNREYYFVLGIVINKNEN